MRIDSEQLVQHLSRGLKPLYVVYGEELLLSLEAADRIRAAARKGGHDERRVLIADAGFDWSELAMAGNSLSLFAPRRVLDLRIPSGKPGKEGSEALQEFAGALPEDTVVLVTLPDIDRQSQASKWFSALDAAGTMVQAAAIKRERLATWLAGRLALQNQQADSATLEFMVERVQGNLMAAHQEVQKLALLFPEGLLPFDEVRNAVVDVARFDVFDIGATLLRGERAHLVRMLDGLRAEGAATPLVLWAMAEEARTMARVKAAQEEGRALQQVMRDLRIWGPRQELMPAALGRLSRSRLVATLRRAAEVDRMIKGLADGDVWDALLQLGLGLMPQPPQGRTSANKGKIGSGIRE
ncbi:MAG TPA: DNA polymerase III subunit delta [Burkholderiales bacterium]|nr:DNA polymerase III subunit delta [Burkholderiales bacterium]